MTKRKLKRKKKAPREVTAKRVATNVAKAKDHLVIERRAEKAANLAELTTIPPAEAKRDNLHLIKHQAMIDYVTDPDCRSVPWHFERPDRRYGRYVTESSFTHWSKSGGWVARRKQFWDKLSLRMLDDEQDRLLKEQKQEADQLRFIRKHLVEHLMPVVDSVTGDVMRYPDEDKHGEPHPLAGKPVLPYHISSYDKALKAFLEVDERLMLKRGEVIDRVENAAAPAADGSVAQGTSPLDPATQSVKFTPQQLRVMSRSLLREKQPELAQPLAIDLDEEPEHDADDESI